MSIENCRKQKKKGARPFSLLVRQCKASMVAAKISRTIYQPSNGKIESDRCQMFDTLKCFSVVTTIYIKEIRVEISCKIYSAQSLGTQKPASFCPKNFKVHES